MFFSMKNNLRALFVNANSAFIDLDKKNVFVISKICHSSVRKLQFFCNFMGAWSIVFVNTIHYMNPTKYVVFKRFVVL